MIGLFGGTFVPIHNGHLKVVTQVCAEMDLDEIIVVPAGYPYMKNDVLTSPENRLRMVELALDGLPKLSVSDTEIKRCGPSYTADTFRELQAIRSNQEISVIMGMDAVLGIPRWDNPKEFIDLCKIIAITRPNHQAIETSKIHEQYENANISILPISTPDISSTEIRERVAEGRDFKHMVPKKVAEFIIDNQLYLPGP